MSMYTDMLRDVTEHALTMSLLSWKTGQRNMSESWALLATALSRALEIYAENEMLQSPEEPAT